VRFMRALVHAPLGGRLWLGLLFWLEERFPRFFWRTGPVSVDRDLQRLAVYISGLPFANPGFSGVMTAINLE